MQLLKFKSELSPPAVPSTELAQLVKFSLHHPESYTHRFTQNRWDTPLHGGDTPQTDFNDLVSLPPPEKPATPDLHGCGCGWLGLFYWSSTRRETRGRQKGAESAAPPMAQPHLVNIDTFSSPLNCLPPPRPPGVNLGVRVMG